MSVAKPCLKDGNAGDNSCGEKKGATCTGTGGLGACCGEWGWCGSSEDHCGKNMQKDYSHSKGLCSSEESQGSRGKVDRSKCHCGDGPDGPGTCQGLTMEDVANTWVRAVWPLNQEDAVKMCVPAVVVAAGSSFDMPGCEGLFHPKIAAEEPQETTPRGIWQIGKGFDPDPKVQAAAVYKIYTSSDVDRGCLAQWCRDSGCSEPLQGIGQDQDTMKHHRFCTGSWPQGTEKMLEHVESLGGKAAVEKACSTAAIAVAAVKQTLSPANAKEEAKEEAKAKEEVKADRSKCHCGQDCQGMTLEEVADTWISTIWPRSREDALNMCVPAMAIAAGSSFGAGNCEGFFNPRAKGGDGGDGAASKGLWQISHGYDNDVAKQVLSVYDIYTSNNTDFGCLSQWCSRSDCGIPKPGIGQDKSATFQHHLFCQGAWGGDAELYQRGLDNVGGIDEVHRVCAATAAHIKAAHQKAAEESTVFGEAKNEGQAQVVVVGDKGQQSSTGDASSVFGEATAKSTSGHVTVVDDAPKEFGHRLKVLAYGSLAMG